VIVQDPSTRVDVSFTIMKRTDRAPETFMIGEDPGRKCDLFLRRS